MTATNNQVYKPDPKEVAKKLLMGESVKFGYFTEESGTSDDTLINEMRVILGSYEEEFSLPKLKIKDIEFIRGEGYSAIRCYVCLGGRP